MKEIKNLPPRKKIEYVHYVTFKGKRYIREEYLSLKHFAWQNEPDKLLDLHTIKWKYFKTDENIEYFSVDMGWSKDGKLDKSNTIPEIELEFKKTIGKNLIYF